MTTIYFVRHGAALKPKNIILSRLPGYYLNELGKRQVADLAEKFGAKQIEAIYSSPIERCHQTAKIIGDHLGLPVVVDERINEAINVFAGMLEEDWDNLYEGQSLYLLPKQQAEGETAQQIKNRMESFLTEMLEKYPDKTIIVVSHGDPIMILEYFLTGKDYQSFNESQSDYIPEAGYFEFSFENKKMAAEKKSWE